MIIFQKNKIFFKIFLIIFFAFNLSAKDTNPDRIFCLFNEDLSFKKEFLEFLKIFNITYNGNLKDLVNETQKKFLRKKERWEEKDRYFLERKKVLPLLYSLGCIKEIKPLKKKYDYALVLGSLFTTVENRLDYLIDLWNEGVRFDVLVFLGGKRALLKDLEQSKFPKNIKKMPQTETEMMKWLYESKKFSKIFKKKVIFVDTPMQAIEGGYRRPNTLDTIKEWKKKSYFFEKETKCLFISNQPYIGYQDATVRRVLKDFYIETVGNHSYEKIKFCIYLDSIARWLYSEYLRMFDDLK